MSLLDQFGQSIPAADVRRLRTEITAPTLAGVRPAFSWSPADGMTPARLAQIHRDAARGISQRYLELAEDIEERDLHYAAVLATRKRAVSQLPVTVTAASDDPAHVEHADFIRRWLDTGVFEGALFDVLDGVGKGFSVHEIIWRTDPGRIWPEQLLYRPQRWFEVGRDEPDAIMLREATTRLPLAPHKFLLHRHPGKSGLVMRSGLARVASWAWMWKAFTLADWAAFVRNYGQPLRLGKYGPESTSEDRDVLWRAVANIAGDTAAIVPRGMEIEFAEVGDLKAGAELYERRCDWLDRQVSKLVLGQTTTTDAVSGGHAVAREHRLVQEDIERADARMVSTTVTRQLVHAIIAFNFGPQDAYPKLLIGRPDEVPLREVIEGVSKLVPLGLRVEASELRDRLGLAEPAEDAEVLGPRPAAAPAAPPALNAQLPTPEALDVLGVRTAQGTRRALGGMAAQIREEVGAATDLQDLANRLARLQMDPEALAVALGQGLTLAHLAGQAALLDELGSQGS